MSSDNYQNVPGLVAGEALTAAQYKAVYLSTTVNNQVLQVSDANAQRPVRILQNNPASGEPADVAISGVCKWDYGGIITRGNTLACDDTGQAIADAEVTDGSAVDLHHLADALESGVDGDLRKVLLHTPVRIGLE